MALFACIGFGLLQAGCNALDATYIREGIGTNLNSTELVEVTKIQELYVGEICRQAGLQTRRVDDAVYCDEVYFRSNEWATFVQAGMNDIDRRCDAYLGWLDNKRRWREPVLKQLATTAAATAAVMGLTGASTQAIAIAGAAFGFAADSFVNFNARLITEIEQSTVQSVVLGNQSEFRVRIVNSSINNRPAAIYLLRNYLRICMPLSIEMSINNTVAVYHRSGSDGLREPQILIRGPEVARRTALPPLAPTDQMGAPVRVAKLTTIEDYKEIIERFDPRTHTISKIEPVLVKLCVPEAELRAIGERTKLAIKIYQLGLVQEMTGKLSRRQLLSTNNLKECEAGRLNSYENSLADGLKGAIADLNKGLEANRKLDANASDVEIRSRIPELRAKFDAKLKLKSHLLTNQITPDLIGVLRRSSL